MISPSALAAAPKKAEARRAARPGVAAYPRPGHQFEADRFELGTLAAWCLALENREAAQSANSGPL